MNGDKRVFVEYFDGLMKDHGNAPFILYATSEFSSGTNHRFYFFIQTGKGKYVYNIAIRARDNMVSGERKLLDINFLMAGAMNLDNSKIFTGKASQWQAQDLKDDEVTLKVYGAVAAAVRYMMKSTKIFGIHFSGDEQKQRIYTLFAKQMAREFGYELIVFNKYHEFLRDMVNRFNLDTSEGTQAADFLEKALSSNMLQREHSNDTSFFLLNPEYVKDIEKTIDRLVEFETLKKKV
jgi:hypothetical protein